MEIGAFRFDETLGDGKASVAAELLRQAVEKLREVVEFRMRMDVKRGHRSLQGCCPPRRGQALASAGANPSRGSVLQALQGITSFSGGNLVGTANPAKKIPTTCYIIARIEHGRFNRLDDPPASDPSHGYRCDQPFYYVKA